MIPESRWSKKSAWLSFRSDVPEEHIRTTSSRARATVDAVRPPSSEVLS